MPRRPGWTACVRAAAFLLHVQHAPARPLRDLADEHGRECCDQGGPGCQGCRGHGRRGLHNRSPSSQAPADTRFCDCDAST
eukprot:10800902-Alexandrium_andersonii.AAC.1